MKITIFIPTLNEADGLPVFLPRIMAMGYEQVIVSDGGSKDGTQEIARQLGAEVYVQKKKGIRHAYMEAWGMIRGDIVVTLSPDGNCIPEDIPKLIEKLVSGKHDMVVASRYYGGIKSEDDDAVTGFGNWLFTRTVNLLFGARYSDAMGIFRAYRTSLFYELGLDLDASYELPEKLFGTVIGVEPLLSVRAVSHGKSVSEMGSPEPKRLGGERKLQVLRWGAAYYFQFWTEFVWRRRVTEKSTALSAQAASA